MPIPLIGRAVEQGRAEQGHQAHCALDARPRPGRASGPTSGTEYQTPVNVFPPAGFVVALTYGPDADWVKNVLAAGGCELRTRGRAVHLIEPRLFHDETRHHIRPLERQVLGVIGVADFLSLKNAPASAPSGQYER